MLADMLKSIDDTEMALAPSITEMIDGALAVFEMSIKTNYYPSMFTSRYWCKRQHVINQVFFGVHGEYPREVDEVAGRIFCIGNAVHKIFQDDILSRSDNFLGKWACSPCNSKLDAGEEPILIGTNENWVSKPDHECSVCGYELWEYAEVRAVNDKYGWSGRIDGIIRHLDEEYLLDIKTKDTVAFDAMCRDNVPDFGYVMQLQCYMEATGVKKALLYYVEKNRLRDKVFLIHYNPTGLAKLYAETIDEVNARMARDSMPPRHSWCSKNSWMEDGCVYGNKALDICRGPRKISRLKETVECLNLQDLLSKGSPT